MTFRVEYSEIKKLVKNLIKNMRKPIPYSKAINKSDGDIRTLSSVKLRLATPRSL